MQEVKHMTGVNTHPCRDCGGTGLCTNCNGSGRTQCVHCDDGLVPHDTWGYDDNPFQSIQICDYCNGTGHIACPDCYGSGLCDTCN
jgi:DnaJ-class molecular chaperone